MKLTATFIFMLLIFSHAINGQKSSGEISYNKKISKDRVDTYRSGLSQVKDTLFPPIFFEECANEVFSFLNPVDWGFIGGTSSFGDLEKAQRFSVEAAEMIRIEEIGVFFAEVQVVSDGNVSVKIYEVDDATGGPGTLISTSNTVKASEISVAQNDLLITAFTFDNPPVVEGDAFFVSVDLSALYASNDTVSIFMSDIDCGNDGDSWELFGDNITWASLADPDLSWNISSNFLMAAIVEYEQTTSTVEVKRDNPMIIFPNPARDLVNINFDPSYEAPETLELFSVDGKQLIRKTFNSNAIDISNIEQGVYLIKATTKTGIDIQKLVIQR